jgi:putative transcriptional regulator
MKAKAKPVEIEFDPEELVRRVQGFAEGTVKARERVFKLPPPVKKITAAEIRKIRTKFGYSQAEFAAMLNVPKVTAISWENGVRKPSGAALRLLAIARKHPEALQAS